MGLLGDIWLGGSGDLIATAECSTLALLVNGSIGLFLLRGGRSPKSLTRAGVVHAGVLGWILMTCVGVSGWILCAAFLVAGSLLTKVGRERKILEGTYENRQGARGPENVWGAGLFPALIAIALASFQLMPNTPKVWINGIRVGYTAALATKMWDTTASEVGKAYGTTTILITTLSSVPRGTEGGVSVEGTAAGTAASLIIALLSWSFDALPRGLSVPIIVTAATIANIFEAVIGSTLQGAYQLSNELVNVINTLIGAALSMGLSAVLNSLS
uniref:TIGR00297 family protein n=1 Tax=Rhodosorus marinus TaxID=101924 RepID=A0A7S0G464_9RHOD|mmetsp:Transcript_4698/g.6507  ORF Transcript_4698/g.6507 Transcript_4698/m.6507 type:complete len:272 (+) Transcript_4698:41-856(+)